MAVPQAPAKNLTVLRHDDIMARHNPGDRWAEVGVIEDGRNLAVWICGPEGSPPDPHIHPNFNEWWIVMDGKTRWQIGQYEPVVAEWGDVIIAPAGFPHDIRPWDGDSCVRLGVTMPGSNHDIKGIAPSRFIPVDEGLEAPNLIHTSLKKMLAEKGTTENWKQLVVLDDRNRTLLTHEIPGTVNRRYWHPDMHKWWAILDGEIEYRIADREPVRAGRGDLVFVEAGTSHELETVGEKPSIRLTVTSPDIVHHYTDDPDAPPAPNG